MKLLGLFLTMFCSSLPVHAKELMSLKTFLKSELHGAAKLSKESFNVSPQQHNEIAALAQNSQDKTFNFYYGKDKDKKLLVACTVVAQKGKEGPMLLGICFEPSGLVKSVKLLTSDEDHGSKAQGNNFLKQFEGKNVSSAFQVGKDIDGISGATITSKAISEAVRKSNYAFKTFVRSKK